jgi:hypothetical protein
MTGGVEERDLLVIHPNEIAWFDACRGWNLG